MFGKFRMKRRMVVVVVALALVVTGSAIAGWIVMSTGKSGKGVIGTIQPISVDTALVQDAPPCFPGVGACTVKVNIVNPNAFPVIITAVTYASGKAVSVVKGAVDDSANCPAANFTFASQTGLHISVPAGTSDVMIPGAYTIASAAPQACMGDFVFYGGASDTTYSIAAS